MSAVEGNLAVGVTVERPPIADVELSDHERVEFARLRLQLGEAVELTDVIEGEPRTLEVAQALGSAVVADEAENSHELRNDEASRSKNLMEATRKAREGDLVAKAMVRANVATDRVERTFKSQVTLNVRLQVDENGEWLQNGQSYDAVHENAEEHINDPILEPRTVIEAANKKMIMRAYQQGLLKDNVIVIRSRVKDGLTPEQADNVGWYGDTMSMALQLIYQDGDDIVIESSFLAGAEGRGMPRFDKEACERMRGDVLGLNSTESTAEESLARPDIVSKDKLPAIYSSDGELMMRGGVLVDGYDGSNSKWFGKSHEGPRDYRAHLDSCQRNEQDAEADIEDVVQQLINEADSFRAPTDATKRLHELNEAKLKKAIIVDSSIDPAVLGQAALPYVLEARLHYQAGEIEKLSQSYEKVVELGVSSSCPTGINADAGLGGIDGLSSIFAGEDKYGSLEFKCKRGCTNKRPRNTLIEKCQKCGVSVRC